nr:MAG TPA: hypothetical protein [Caudoviricetes sp.]
MYILSSVDVGVTPAAPFPVLSVYIVVDFSTDCRSLGSAASISGITIVLILQDFHPPAVVLESFILKAVLPDGTELWKKLSIRHISLPLVWAVLKPWNAIPVPSRSLLWSNPIINTQVV